MTPTAQQLGMISAENDRDVRILLGNPGGPARRNLGRTKCSKVAFRRSHAYFVHSTRFGCATSPLPPTVPTSDVLVDDQSACMVGQIPVYQQPTKVCKRKIFSGATRFANPSFYVSPDCPPSRFQIVTVDKIPLAKFQQYLVFAFARDPVSRALSIFTYCRGLRSGPKATLVDILGRCDRLNQHLQIVVDLVNRGRRVDLPPLPSVHELVAKSNFDPKSKSQSLDRCDATCIKALRTGTFASDFVLWDRLSSS
ncbi:Hypothetical Protein FCC1311_084372 [Hondaea fermentalgiana]|uniref:Uncharacterized protein n=1 Tax=Hondaea fermentalgiana TaxID=2315210 RepID=A0A2R5GMT8_9STRA|nr:Hypothetical Protein FCC1311_084372 [Hondaea fermentalgiana]|eukprot:GBG32212.1 Hypothetical Protein FCC1311_084372 [Hondaea fermentalgiana]